MRLKFKKYILPILLILLVGSAEIIGVIVCANIIPDYKNETFKEEKKNSTQLMFVGEEDNSRFYPWLSYNKSTCESLEKYAKRLYSEIMKELDYQDTSNKTIHSESLEQNFYSSYVNDYNNTIMSIICIFEGNNVIDKNTDFSKKLLINDTNNFIYLENFECSGTDGKKKLLDLVITFNNDILYYRFRNKETRSATSSEINQKSKKLTEDIQYVINNKSLFGGKNSEINYDSEKSYNYQINTDENPYNNEEESKSTEDNYIVKYFDRIKSENKIVSYDDYDIRYNLSLKNDKNAESFGITLPSYLTKDPFSIFSYNDELMIVFSERDSQSKNSNTILYYSISDNKITGFSIGL